MRSIELAPKLVFAHYWAALNSVAMGQYEQARLALERARQLAPGFVESRLNGPFPGFTAEVAERMQIFLRIAAGLEDPSAADAWR